MAKQHWLPEFILQKDFSDLALVVQDPQTLMIAGTTPTRLATRVATKMDPQHPHSHSLSMLGAERYQNQLNSTANAELFK